jgi:hypothetical protein
MWFAVSSKKMGGLIPWGVLLNKIISIKGKWLCQVIFYEIKYVSDNNKWMPKCYLLPMTGTNIRR